MVRPRLVVLIALSAVVAGCHQSAAPPPSSVGNSEDRWHIDKAIDPMTDGQVISATLASIAQPSATLTIRCKPVGGPTEVDHAVEAQTHIPTIRGLEVAIAFDRSTHIEDTHDTHAVQVRFDDDDPLEWRGVYTPADHLVTLSGAYAAAALGAERPLEHSSRMAVRVDPDEHNPATAVFSTTGFAAHSRELLSACAPFDDSKWSSWPALRRTKGDKS